jgi:hypothetical protein
MAPSLCCDSFRPSITVYDSVLPLLLLLLLLLPLHHTVEETGVGPRTFAHSRYLAESRARSIRREYPSRTGSGMKGIDCVRCAPHESADTNAILMAWWISLPRHKDVLRRDGKDGRCHLILDEPPGAARRTQEMTDFSVTGTNQTS